MKDYRVSAVYFLMCIMITFTVACGDDDEAVDDDMQTTEEMLVGTWTTSDAEISAEVDGQSLTDYLANVLGWSVMEAETYSTIFEAGLEESVTGSITLNSDNTYESDFGGGSDEGTWSLSTDETTLTLDEGTVDEVDLTINAVTSTSLNVSLGDIIFEDLDDDPETDDEEIIAEAVISLTM